MIPIRDINRSERYPIVNIAIIAVNVAVYLLQLGQGQEGLQEFFIRYGLVPARYSDARISAYFTLGQQILPFLSFMFLHGGFFHLLGNMWSLFIFGDNVEDRLGHFRYLLFYVLCGLASGISHLAINWHSEIPTIGASGAISGVMGAYLLLYPKARILVLVPIFFFLQFLEVPAFVFLGIWFFFQFISAAGASAQAGGIAWWAHIGGFLFGMLFLKLVGGSARKWIEKKNGDITRRRKTQGLHVIRPTASDGDLDSYGTITVSEREARLGTRKMVNLAHGVRKRTFLVTIPPGVSPGTTLRLQGLGRRRDNGARGDLYLKVHIR